VTRLQLSPSILTADFARLGDEVRSVSPYVDWFHLDVMDGHYVDNITFGASTIEAVNASVDQPLHVHLMIQDPDKYIESFVKAGADRISFHPEVTPDPGAVIDRLESLGTGVGLAVHPDVGLGAIQPYLDRLDVVLMMTVRPGFGGQAFLDEVVPEIARARELIEAGGHRADIEVDGGVKLGTVDAAVGAGGEILVAGSAIFDGVDAPAAARALRARLDELEGQQT
jgi:ribulose-phosphate 3-epimerase